MTTNFNIFNTTRNGIPIIDRPKEIQPHLLKQVGEEFQDESMNEHQALIGRVVANTSGHPHKEHYHSTTPFNKIIQGGERPVDIVFEDTAFVPVGGPYDFPSNHELNLRFFNVYEDGTSVFDSPSDDRLAQQNKREQIINRVNKIIDMIALAYSSRGTPEERKAVNDLSISMQTQLMGAYPEVASHLASISRQYQNQIQENKMDNFLNQLQQQRTASVKKETEKVSIAERRKTFEDEVEKPKKERKVGKLNQDRLKEIEDKLEKGMKKKEMEKVAKELNIKNASKTKKNELQGIIEDMLKERLSS